MNGTSAGQAPNQVRRLKTATKLQKTKRNTGENIYPQKISFELFTEKRKSTQTEQSKATTPPSLLGTERKIA